MALWVALRSNATSGYYPNGIELVARPPVVVSYNLSADFFAVGRFVRGRSHISRRGFLCKQPLLSYLEPYLIGHHQHWRLEVRASCAVVTIEPRGG